MITRSFISLWHHARYIPLLSALTYSRGQGFERRAQALGTMIGLVMRLFPVARRRFDTELLRVFPEIPRRARVALCQSMGRNMGKTLFEIYHCAEFQAMEHRCTVSGPGLAALRAARAEGRGAIIVSGHFGQWEAIRSVLKARGMETGAVYRPQRNRHYERRLRSGIEAGGAPILEVGSTGTKALVRHVREGGFIAILLDEKSADGVRLPFLGHGALTSLSAARLAVKYDLPMVPAFGTRVGEGCDFEVVFEAPIAHGDARAMTEAFNDSLSARIRETPDQWYWMLRRWRDM